MELQQVSKRITMEKMARYSGAGNFHSDDTAGEQLGLGGAIVQGGQLVGYLNEMLTRSLGAGFIAGGEVAVNFIRPARPGDTVTTHGTLTATAGQVGTFEIWLENQNGEKLVVGTASALLPEA
ncbi:MAG: MaoC family dehydratase [Acetobacteraceae bacterium]